MRVITFGTFDIFHVGHLNLLERCRSHGSHLTVGVSTDELNASKKGRMPIYSLEERCRILGALRVVDEVFHEASLDLKREYVKQHRADILIMGDDWAGRFDHLSDICKVVYLPRTPSISTSATIEKIKQ